jgi:hypothetical protein
VRDGPANHRSFVQRTANRGPWVLALDVKCGRGMSQSDRLVPLDESGR